MGEGVVEWGLGGGVVVRRGVENRGVHQVKNVCKGFGVSTGQWLHLYRSQYQFFNS